MYGIREDTGSRLEILLERNSHNRWQALVKPGKKAKIGSDLSFGNGLLRARVIDIIEDGSRILEFQYQGIFEEILDEIGVMPLPPYIHERLDDRERYQTVYNKYAGSSAAPTAGLHFTNELLDDIENDGVKIARITLHVGLGTFRPVKVDDINQHKMHFETYSVSEETAKLINQCRDKGGKIIAVGTTSARTLETVADEKGIIHHGSGKTDIFIYPGYKFKGIDGLITNFHLPKSTLIMLVAALIGKDEVLDVYKKRLRLGIDFLASVMRC